jgi:hypothetical protein
MSRGNTGPAGPLEIHEANGQDPIGATTGPETVQATPAALLVLLGLALGLAWQGAYYPRGQLALALCLTGGLVATLSTPPRRSELLWPPVTAVATLGAWILINATLHGTPGRGTGGAAVALAVVVTLLIVRRLEDPDRRLLLTALPVLGGLVAAGAWIGLVLRLEGWSQEAQGLWRAAGSLTYSNATAAALAVLAVLGVTMVAMGDARDPGHPEMSLVPVAATSALTTMMLTGLVATLSRGGALALTTGLVVLVAGGRWTAVRAGAGPVLGSLVALGALVPSLAADHRPRPVLAAGGLIAGLILSELVRRSLIGERYHGREPGRRPLGAVVVAASTMVTLVVVGPEVATVAQARLGSGSSYRVGAARVAIESLARQPVLGTGPDGAVSNWRDGSGADITLRYLHNEYLQVVVENGLIGGVLLLGVVVAMVMAANRRRHRSDHALPPGGGFDLVHRGGLAATASFAVSSLFDITWHVPVLPVLSAVVLGAALDGQRPPLWCGPASTRRRCPHRDQPTTEGEMPR